MGSVTTINLRPRWWQFIRRFKEWRERKALVGEVIVIDGTEYTITDYSPDDLVTIDEL